MKDSRKKSKASSRKSLYGRRSAAKFERKRGKNRQHRPIEEKLRKYEVRGEGFEFIPAMMHLLHRYTAGVPKQRRNKLDDRLARALDEIPNAKKLLGAAVKQHLALPREMKRRVFSPKYLDLDVEQEIGVAEIEGILRAARGVKNLTVQEIRGLLATKGDLDRGDKHNCCCPEGEGRPEPPPPPTRKPNPYDLTFTKLYCVDESDPEFAGSDEPYLVFGIITEEMAEAGTAARAVASPVYEDVDDGDTRPSSGDQNLRLFGFTGARPIDTSVLVTGSCFEHDLGDVSDTTDAVRSALTTAATTAAGAGGVAGWVIAGVAVVAIGVTYLVDLIGADDQVGGTLALSLTQAQADANTDSVNPFIFPPLHFDGGDDDGIYDAYLKLRRA
jgi:hypothetical protein